MVILFLLFGSSLQTPESPGWMQQETHRSSVKSQGALIKEQNIKGKDGERPIRTFNSSESQEA